MQIKQPTECAAKAKQAGSETAIYFDGGSSVCFRKIAICRSQEGAERCAWADVLSCAASTFGLGLSCDMALARIHVRGTNGDLVDGVGGFAFLSLALPRSSWAGRRAWVGLITFLRKAACWIFLKERPLCLSPLSTSASAE